MSTAQHRDEVLSKARADYLRGPLDQDEQVEFDCQKAWAQYELERRKFPERFAPELPLKAAA